MSISVNLILKSHFPERNGVWNESDYDKLDKVNLCGKNIKFIDNLELFSDIRELHLKDNHITDINNIEFLNKLEVLDISNNNINSKSLSSERFPKNLKYLNICGNPCAQDTKAIEKLQSEMTQLDIVYESTSSIDKQEIQDGEEDAEEGEDTFEDCDLIAGENAGDSSNKNNVDIKIDADLVLREIVDRKCRLQNVDVFDLNSCVEELNSESKVVIERKRERKRVTSYETTSSYDSNSSDQSTSNIITPLFQSKIDSLKMSRTDDDDSDILFINNLRKNAMKKLDTYHRNHEQDILKSSSSSANVITENRSGGVNLVKDSSLS